MIFILTETYNNIFPYNIRVRIISETFFHIIGSIEHSIITCFVFSIFDWRYTIFLNNPYSSYGIKHFSFNNNLFFTKPYIVNCFSTVLCSANSTIV